MWWLAEQDVFTFEENAPSDDMKYTKRNFLRKIATLFDPLGLLAPFIIRAKLLLQEMWTAGLEEDDKMNTPLISSLISSALSWFSELHDLKQVQVPRCLQAIERTIESVSLQIFVDASKDAYRAVAYAKYTYLYGTISTNIVAAKTRVSPVETMSIPRPELLGAVISVRLSTRISEVFELQVNHSVFWSDRLNVLWSVRGRSRSFKPFCCQQSRRITDQQQSRSRGIQAVALANCEK